MAQKKSTIHVRKQKEKNGMQILVATFLVLFIFCFSSSVFAQDKNVKPVRPFKDGLGEQIEPNENETKSEKKDIGQIPLQ